MYTNVKAFAMMLAFLLIDTGKLLSSEFNLQRPSHVVCIKVVMREISQSIAGTKYGRFVGCVDVEETYDWLIALLVLNLFTVTNFKQQLYHVTHHCFLRDLSNTLLISKTRRRTAPAAQRVLWKRQRRRADNGWASWTGTEDKMKKTIVHNWVEAVLLLLFFCDGTLYSSSACFKDAYVFHSVS